MRAKNKKYIIAILAVSLLICLVIGSAILFPAPDQLTYLQNQINENGHCNVSSGDMNFDIQADTAIIENNTLILKRKAITGEESYVVINSKSNPMLAKSVSIRFITTPKEMLELSISDAINKQVSFPGTFVFKNGMQK